MRKHFANVAYGVLDYVSYPLGMLLVAPLVLHKLGAAEYGLWMIATAVVSTGGIVASGFCDANMQRVARLRGKGTVMSSMIHAVRGMFGINLVLGCIVGAIVAIVAPVAARRITTLNPHQALESMVELWIASVLIVVRAIESVWVSTQRAFEQYGHSVKINTTVRWCTLGSAAILVLLGMRTISILIVTSVFLTAGTYLQFREAQKLLGDAPLSPTFQRREARALLGFGVFVWLQTLGGVIFGHFDRVFLGVSLGATAVAPYALCVQFTQPIFGLTASGLQFLFPYLSARVGTIPAQQLKWTLLKVFLCNALLVACGSAMLMMMGQRLIQLWAGATIAHEASYILPQIVLGTALMGLSVTGTYAILALGLFRTVALLSLFSRGALLLAMAYLVRRFGLEGLGISRVLYGISMLLLYVPLLRKLQSMKVSQENTFPLEMVLEQQEVSKP